MIVKVESEKETREFAKKLAEQLKGGETLFLNGELGSGKTTFTRYLVTALGIDTPVSSPTFVLEHEYQKPNELLVIHRDLYRLTSLPDEFCIPPESNEIHIIEWADKFSLPFDKPIITLHFEMTNPNTRQITIEASPKIIL